MLPTKFKYGQWPGSGEIDIMEHVGYDMERVHGTVHTKSFNHSINTQKGNSLIIENVHKKFNVYSIEWYPNKILFFINDKHYFTFNNRKKSWQEWPFDIPFHLILNIAVGGGWGGIKGIDDSIWPQTMEVEYVRVYDLNLDQRDQTPPTTPNNIKSEINPISAKLNWDNSNDDFGLKEYRIYLNNKLISKSNQSNYKINYLKPETKYNLYIEAIDYADNKSKSKSYDFITPKLNHHPVPGKVEAEDYLSMEKGVETEKTKDLGGGVNLCYIGDHDWMEYTIDVKESGNYQALLRSAAVIEGEVQIKDENNKILSTIEVPVTDDWQNWTTVRSNQFTLQKGKQKIKVYTTIGGFNFNWFKILKAK
ncbi:MAG: carbohydrate-binding protein [Halanaerobiales bacterium]|nr:carbohydrate-binding protein [Halanaerobiales bacterium]